VSEPTPPPRWRRTPDERPRQILNAALEVFGEAGLAGAKIDDIAERAGISKGTIYLYFPSKDELFREVLRDAFGEIVETVTGLSHTASATDDLTAFARDYWAFLRSPRFETVYRLLISEIHAFPEMMREFGREVRDPIKATLQTILDRGAASGEFVAGSSAVRARMLMALLWQHGIWCAKREFNPELQSRTDDVVLSEVITFYLDAIANE
jgi:AcrR family transcriptional regulator